MKPIKDFSGDDVFPRWEERDGRLSLVCTVTKSLSWIVLLGRVKRKNDGRWEWTIQRETDFYKAAKTQPKLQGVCDTLEEAKTQVELVWGVA